VITNSLLGSSIGTIRMLRAVMTTDIRLNPDETNNNIAQGFPHFRLKDVKLYNVPQKGYTVPNPDYVTKTPNTLLVTKPTYSDSFTLRIIHHVADAAQQQDEYGMGGVIYMPEAPNLNATGANIDDSQQTCLVISGYYGAGNTTTETWYRIDFINSLSTTEDLRYDILRNHFCSLLITSVNGPGYDTEEEAFNSAPVNIESKVMVWDQYDMSDIIFDGTYYLAVTKGEYILSREAQGDTDEENKLTVETNTEGWTAAVWGNSEGTTAVPNDPVTGSPWLSITPTSGNGNPNDPGSIISINMPRNGGSTPRTAYILITASSKLKYVVRVTQLAEEVVKLTLYDKDMNEVAPGEVVNREVFPWQEEETLVYYLEWLPKEATVEVLFENGNSAENGLLDTPFSNTPPPSGTPFTDPEGRKMLLFTIPNYEKKQIDSENDFGFPKRGFKYTFTVKHVGEPDVVKSYLWKDEQKTVQVLNTPAGKQQGTYPGVKYRYNTPYQLVVEDTEDALDSQSKSDLPTRVNAVTDVRESYRIFRVNTNSDLSESKRYDGRKATLRFIVPDDPAKVFHEMVIENVYNYPNSYMATTSDGSIEFPLRKAFQVWEHELLDEPLPGGNLRMEVIWTDKDGLISNMAISPNSDIQKSTVRVYFSGNTADNVGNAVVGLFSGSEMIYSWHIWRIDYDPNVPAGQTSHSFPGNFIFMDRNLGAMENNVLTNPLPATNSTRMGLYYQWGRKDPFPGPNDLHTVERDYVAAYRQPVYSPSNREPAKGEIAAGTRNNLKNSLQNPHIFYSNPNSPYDWFTTNEITKRDDFWMNKYCGSKGVFDPCPEGWRTPHDKYPAGATTAAIECFPNPPIALAYTNNEYVFDMSTNTAVEYRTLGNYFRILILNNNGRFQQDEKVFEAWLGMIIDPGWNFIAGQLYGNRIFNSQGEVEGYKGATGKASARPVRCIIDDPAYWTNRQRALTEQYDHRAVP
ncbi:MAG: BACON domain-containing protein, partial [Clostridium sp.]|nr:BACON domain-containing protein [Clostridium sp.]